MLYQPSIYATSASVSAAAREAGTCTGQRGSGIGARGQGVDVPPRRFSSERSQARIHGVAGVMRRDSDLELGPVRRVEERGCDGSGRESACMPVGKSQ